MGLLDLLADWKAKRELRDYLARLKTVSDDEMGDVLMDANEKRIQLIIKGLLPDGAMEGEPVPADYSWHGYPFRLSGFLLTLPHVERAGGMPWLHTLRALLRPVLRPLAHEMWAELARGKKTAWETMRAAPQYTRLPFDETAAEEVTFIPPMFNKESPDHAHAS